LRIPEESDRLPARPLRVLVPDIRSSRSGKISTLAHPAIGVFYPRRLDIPQFNNVPIGRELGYDVELPQFGSIVVKAGTDPALVSSPMNWVKSPKRGIQGLSQATTRIQTAMCRSTRRACSWTRGIRRPRTL
jgi:hypothetical protein